jgi:class 3 adenylate cyclase
MSADWPRSSDGPPHVRWLIEKHELLCRVNCVAELVDLLLSHSSVRGSPDAMSDLHRIRSGAEKWRGVIGEYFSHDLAGAAEELEFRRTLDYKLRSSLIVIIGFAEYLTRHAERLGLQPVADDLKQLAAWGNQSLQMTDEIVYRIRRAARPTQDLVPKPRRPEKCGSLLLVEDHEDERHLLERHLTQEGHRVRTALDTESALDLFAHHPFDLVLLNLMLPKMKGLELLRRLRADLDRANVPVLVISASDEPGLIAESFDLGADDYCIKPFNPKLLQAHIDFCLAKRWQRQKVDDLLHSLLPRYVVPVYLEKGEFPPQEIDNVAVLFADLAGFTTTSTQRPSREIVADLEALFRGWEEIAERWGVQKIKTLGDAMMAVAGLGGPWPVPPAPVDPVEACFRCAVEMIAFTRRQGTPPWDLRVGIDVGSVVAGVLGRRRFLFDVWGDCVNTAARMESHGVVGGITLTERAVNRLPAVYGPFTAEVIEKVKGKGPMTVYRYRQPPAVH